MNVIATGCLEINKKSTDLEQTITGVLAYSECRFNKVKLCSSIRFTIYFASTEMELIN